MSFCCSKKAEGRNTCRGKIRDICVFEWRQIW